MEMLIFLLFLLVKKTTIDNFLFLDHVLSTFVMQHLMG